jgi:SAM-dependent methyltransferase
VTTTLNRIVTRYRKSGVRGLIAAIDQRLRPPYTGPAEFQSYVRFFRNRYGLEIGGPSTIFQDASPLPIYSLASRVDGCNFSTSTVWEGTIQEGMHYAAGKNVGFQYIAEARNLQIIPSGKYDFLLASHCLEHVANPLCAMEEWLRVLNSNGVILLVLPDKNATFDHKRPVTPFGHLIHDMERQTAEDDLTHLGEILQLHDLALDPPAGNLEAFEKRSRANFQNRCLHHHVFDLALMREIFDYFDLETILSTTAKPYHMIAIGRKRPGKSRKRTLPVPEP